ncbi:MAG: HD domain-containing protein [Oscillospiraceae bacterium]|nr:HD domain-containing protein [Oscillospiraceae bacterium]
MGQATIKYRDPIHGFIEVRALENKIVDTAAFQRLRNIKQLAFTFYVYHGAEHSRFGHSLGVMHLVTRAFNSAVKGFENYFPDGKKAWCEQILRLIALTHDLGHAPFSHASEDGLMPNGMNHEEYTEKIIMETEISEIINEIGSEFVLKYGEEYDISPKLICDIYTGKSDVQNSEFTFLKSFMDSELDCDKMDYLLRDSYYCGVNYGKYDIDRLISSFTIFNKDGSLMLAIKSGGVQSFEAFVLARYFMFIQVYFHNTRRYFDITLINSLKEILPGGKYPEDTAEYLLWDDCRVIQLLKNNVSSHECCKNIIKRVVYPQIYHTNTHPGEADKKNFKIICRALFSKIEKEYFIIDKSAGKMPHKIPRKLGSDEEGKIIIYNNKTDTVSSIHDESIIISNLTKEIDIMSIYCHPQKSDEATRLIKEIHSDV